MPITTPQTDNMAIEAADWSVVVIGAWNMAILTPDGIRRRLFELPEGSPIDIEVAVDRPGAFRVRHDGVIVEPSSIGLTISGVACDMLTLARACEVGRRALNGLPETPVLAAGINFKYRISEMPDAVLDLLESPLDDKLSDEGLQIVGRVLKRVIQCENGVLNLDIVQGMELDGVAGFNYHLDSNKAEELAEWLTKSERFGEMTAKLRKSMNIDQ